MNCSCDPSGHVFCDPHGGGGSPPWPPCTERSAAAGDGACEGDATTCTESNGWCTRTCTCGGGGCEMTCDGEGPTEPQDGVVCDAEFCADYDFYANCEIADGDCNYMIICDQGQITTLTGSCP